MKTIIRCILESKEVNKDSIKAKNIDELLKKYQKAYGITEEEFEDMFYLIDDKSHLSKESAKTIKKAIRKAGSIPTIKLYRGCSDEELNSYITKGISPSKLWCSSFSEDISIAKKFGKNVITITSKLPLFNYAKFFTDYYDILYRVDKNLYNDEVESSDLKERIKTANNEKEWIVPLNSNPDICLYKLVLTDKDNNEFIIDKLEQDISNTPLTKNTTSKFIKWAYKNGIDKKIIYIVDNYGNITLYINDKSCSDESLSTNGTYTFADAIEWINKMYNKYK